MPQAGHRRLPVRVSRWQPVGFALGEHVRDEAEGPLGLPVGERVRAVLPGRDDAEPRLVLRRQRGERLVHAGQVRGTVIGLGQAHAGQQRADAQLPGAHADGQHGLDPGRDAGGVDDLLGHRQRDHRCRAAPSSRTAAASAPGSSPATRSPSRWEQLIPAACMNVASPSRSGTVGAATSPAAGWCPAWVARPRRPAP